MNQTELSMFNHPFKWFRQQISGWHIANYCLFWFAVGSQLMLLVTGKINLLSIVTCIGTILSVGCILSINAAKSINGVLGVLSALCLIYVGYCAKNYLSCFEQVAYMITLDFPVIFSLKTWNQDTVHHLKKMNLKKWIISIIAIIIVWLISSYLIGHLTNDPRPYFDGINFAISLIAGIMCYLRYQTQFYLWFSLDFTSIALWGLTFLQHGASMAMLISSLTFFANDVIAFSVSPWFNRGRKKMGLKEIKL